MDDGFDGYDDIEVADDGFDNSDLGVVAAPDDDGFGVSALQRNDIKTEEDINSQFRAFHEWYESETGEEYTAGYIPEEIFDRFNTFDMEQGRHLSLVESTQRVIQDNQRAEWEESEFMAGFNEE